MDDLFTSVDDFPYHVAPFPDATDLLFSQPTPPIQSLEIAVPPQNSTPPPQKLRPIRGLERYSPPSSQAGENTDNGGLAVASRDVGYLCNQSSRNFEVLGQQVEAGEELRKGDSGYVAGSSCLPAETPVGGGSGYIGDPNDEGCQLERQSGSSWVNDDNSSGSMKEPGSGKRRKKTIRKLEVFLENLVKKVMEKQEQMHKQLVDMIEKMERERVMREEAWKQQEMERIKKDDEARAQEKSYNLTLISLIQDLLGREIQIPQPAASGAREDDDSEANVQTDFKSDPSNNRWPEAEVQALITLRTSLEHKFCVLGSKVSIWEEISKAMQNMGYNRSAKKCKEKWENINKYYKRTMESGKKRRLNNKACPYFDELDILYRNRLLNIGNAFSNTDNVAKIEKE